MKKIIFNTRTWDLFFTGLLVFALPAVASADVVGTLNSALGLLVNKWGAIVASIALVAGAYFCFFKGVFDKSYFFTMLAGIAILFGAGTIVSRLAGS